MNTYLYKFIYMSSEHSITIPFERIVQYVLELLYFIYYYIYIIYAQYWQPWPGVKPGSLKRAGPALVPWAAVCTATECSGAGPGPSSACHSLWWPPTQSAVCWLIWLDMLASVSSITVSVKSNVGGRDLNPQTKMLVQCSWRMWIMWVPNYLLVEIAKIAI